MTRNNYFRMSPTTYEELLSFIAPKTSVALNGNLITKISDHLPNFIFCKSINLKSKSKNRGFYCDYSNFNLDSYMTCANQTWMKN